MTAPPAGSADAFLDALPYEPDTFQREAARHIERGDTVVVTAPTGAGKTLVAEVAVHLALAAGGRAFYTTPIKALSNQKYQDFVAAYGPGRVGLLTGDNSINGDADVVVMTTEVLRNMIYAKSGALHGLRTVVLDEVHYLADRFRGSVWEEVIIHAPPAIQLVCLSATVANAAEFTEWIQTRRGATVLIEERHRPVPLHPMFMVTDLWNGPRQVLLDMFEETPKGRRPNRQVLRLLSAKTGRRKRFAKPRRGDVIERLESAGMLPVIYFIFSRAGCESAARLVAGLSSVRLTDAAEREEIRRTAAEKTAHLPDGDLAVLGYGRWLADLERGIAAHHAGLVPAFKETVEDLFSRGLVKVVFATETLALGINMPARTVVIDSLTKYDGEGHVLLTPSDFTQLTGRAGRRGIDVEGFGVTLYSPWTKFERMAEIAAAGASRLESSFRPTYNMAVNLIANYERSEAEELLRASFAEFQRAGKLRHQRERQRDREVEIERLEVQARCDLGDASEYAALLEQRIGELVGELKPGDVVEVGSRSAPTRLLVLAVKASDDKPVTALSPAGKIRRLGDADLAGAAWMGTIDVPGNFRSRDRRAQQRLVHKLRSFQPGTASTPVVEHPVAACPDADVHVDALRKLRKLRARRASGKGTEGLVAEFDAVLGVLAGRGYVDGWALLEPGERLRYLYSEMDLLIAEVLRGEMLAGLSGPDLAAVASAFVFEARSGWGAPPPPVAIEEVIGSIEKEAATLAAEEAAYGINVTRRPDFGFCELAYHWAQGFDLDEILRETPMAAGDFVRIARQLLDVLRQIRDADAAIADAANDAIRRVDRGVVAAGGIG